MAQSLLKIREYGNDSYMYMPDAYEASIFQRLSNAVKLKKDYDSISLTKAFAELGQADAQFAFNANSQSSLREQFDRPFESIGVEHKIFIDVDTGEVTISYNPAYAPGLGDTRIGIDAGISRLQAVIDTYLSDAKAKAGNLKNYQAYFVAGMRNFREETDETPYPIKRKYVVQIIAAAISRSKKKLDILKMQGITPNFGRSQAFARLIKDNNFQAAAFLVRNGGDIEKAKEDLGEAIANSPFMQKLEMYCNDLHRDAEIYDANARGIQH